jgi:hypothetical protein
MFLGFVLSSNAFGSDGLFLLIVGVIYTVFLALMRAVLMIIDWKTGQQVPERTD